MAIRKSRGINKYRRTSRRKAMPVVLKRPNAVKKSIMQQKWKKLLRSPIATELKMSGAAAGTATIPLVGTNTNDLPLLSRQQIPGDAWPAQGPGENQRLGDWINIKSMSVQLTFWRNRASDQYCDVRVIVFQSKQEFTIGTNFFRFGSSTFLPTHHCSVNHDYYKVLYDKTFKLGSPGFAAANNQQLPYGTARFTLFKNKRWHFQGSTLGPANGEDQPYIAILPFNASYAGVDITNFMSFRVMYKCIFSD